MKAYFFLAIGALWVSIAIVLNRAGFSVFWRKGMLDPAAVEVIFRLTVPVLLCGWVGPTALGLWLLWMKK